MISIAFCLWVLHFFSEINQVSSEAEKIRNSSFVCSWIFVCLSCFWFQKPIIPVDLYRAVRDSQLVGLSGYTKEVSYFLCFPARNFFFLSNSMICFILPCKNTLKTWICFFTGPSCLCNWCWNEHIWQSICK